MSDLPRPPQQISGDGREIWDWAGKFSEAVHRRDEMRKLSIEIRKIGTTCGDCDKWMKTSMCPAEKSDISGYSKGPSCNGLKCQQLIETKQATERREELKAKLARLEVKEQA